MSSTICMYCGSVASHACTCSNTTNYICEVHLSFHLSFPNDHKVKPLTDPKVNDSKMKLHSKISELEKMCLFQKSQIITAFDSHIKTASEIIKITIQKIDVFYQYCQELQIQIINTLNASNSFSHKPLEKLLISANLDQILSKICMPSLDEPYLQFNINYIPSNISEIIESFSKTQVTKAEIPKLPLPNKILSQSPTDKATEKPKSGLATLRVPKELCIMCNTLDILEKRHCGHSTCEFCLKQRCIICEMDEPSIEIHTQSSKGICRDCGKIGLLNAKKCKHKMCESCSVRKCRRCPPEFN